MATEKNIIMKQFNGTDYDALYPKTTADQIENVYTENQVLSSDTVTKYKLPSGSLPDAVFNKLLEAMPWTLIQEYKTAGSYTWTAPDLYGGASYKIGVYMVGGGGSGGAGGVDSVNASGGASGYGLNIILTVTPGQQIAGVVGAGGASVASSSRNYAGNTGGTTSFNGVTVSGGEGGLIGTDSANYPKGANGGQGSDGTYNYKFRNSPLETYAPHAVYGSCQTMSYGGSIGWAFGGSSQSPRESQNQFDSTMITLSAGGAAVYNNNWCQQIKPMPDGTKGGNGAANTNAENATGNGNGGGAVYVGRSGAGSPGMILIYAKAV